MARGPLSLAWVPSAIGFFVFSARPRFWLPKFAHVLPAIALVVGV
jgi:hypothetical protein